MPRKYTKLELWTEAEPAMTPSTWLQSQSSMVGSQRVQSETNDSPDTLGIQKIGDRGLNREFDNRGDNRGSGLNGKADAVKSSAQKDKDYPPLQHLGKQTAPKSWPAKDNKTDTAEKAGEDIRSTHMPTKMVWKLKPMKPVTKQALAVNSLNPQPITKADLNTSPGSSIAKPMSMAQHKLNPAAPTFIQGTPQVSATTSKSATPALSPAMAKYSNKPLTYKLPPKPPPPAVSPFASPCLSPLPHGSISPGPYTYTYGHVSSWSGSTYIPEFFVGSPPPPPPSTDSSSKHSKKNGNGRNGKRHKSHSSHKGSHKEACADIALYYPGLPIVKAKKWASFQSIEQDRFAKIQRNAVFLMLAASPFMPKSDKEYLEHKVQFIQDEKTELQKRLAKHNPDDPKVTVPAMGGKIFATNHSAVLAQKTIWCPATWNDEQEPAVWPSVAEFKVEGIERAKNGFRRFCPVPRSEDFDWGLATEAWCLDPMQELYPVWNGVGPVPFGERRFADIRSELDVTAREAVMTGWGSNIDMPEELAKGGEAEVVGKALLDAIED